VRLWDAATGEEVFRLVPHIPEVREEPAPGTAPPAPVVAPAQSAMFSPDGRRITMLIDRRLVAWDATASYERLGAQPYVPMKIYQPETRAPSFLPPVKLKRIERGP